MTRTSRDAAAGALAGLVATGPMTAVMELLHRALPPAERRPLPPRRVTMRAADAAGVGEELSEEQRVGATTAAHLAFGTAAGAVYGGLVARHLPLGPAANGVAYGLAVWASHYLGILPALDLYPPPSREPAGRTAANVAAHVAWGLVLGLVTDQLVGSDSRA